MKPTILPLLLAAAIPASLAAQPSAAGRLSVAQAIDRWTSPPADGSDRTSSEILAREYVDGYLAGVADATEGLAWCNAHSTKVHEIDAEVMGVLKSLPPSQSNQTVAAKAAVAALARSFPCKGVRK